MCRFHFRARSRTREISTQRAPPRIPRGFTSSPRQPVSAVFTVTQWGNAYIVIAHLDHLHFSFPSVSREERRLVVPPCALRGSLRFLFLSFLSTSAGVVVAAAVGKRTGGSRSEVSAGAESRQVARQVFHCRSPLLENCVINRVLLANPTPPSFILVDVTRSR